MKFKIKPIEFFTLLCAGMFWFFIGFAVVSGVFLPVAAMFYSLGIIGGFITCGLLDAIKDKRIKEEEAHENGKKYYPSKQEALDARSPGDRIYYDADEKAYYIVAPVKKQF